MLSTPKEASKYIIDTIQEISPIENHFLDEDIVEWIIEDILLEQIAEVLTENDIQQIEKNSEWNDQYFREYCQTYIKNFYTMLENISNDLIAEYLIEDKEIHEANIDDLLEL